MRLLRPAWIQRGNLRDHIIVVGVGQLGELFLETLHAGRKKPRVLLVDTRQSQRLLAKARDQYGAPYVCADIRNTSTLTDIDTG